MKTSNRLPRKRRAAILICVMTCLLIVAGLAATTVRMSLYAARDSRLTLPQHQADWLLRAGVQRAIRAQRQSETYTGETWRLPRSVVGDASAVIVIERGSPSSQAELPQGWRVTARLLSPDGSRVIVQRTHELLSDE